MSQQPLRHWIRRQLALLLAKPMVAALVIALGVLGGLGLATFVQGKGASYLVNDPRVCINCHIMQGSYDAWVHSSHAAVAACNDCHLPHDFLGKWLTKADNGLRHAVAFTTGWFHEPIQITPRNRRVTQGACLHCHGDFVAHAFPPGEANDDFMCVHCHRAVGHAER
ncbi:Cytochrome c-type protein NrfH [Thiorhodovibrio winogradskyi]|uniref:Cytochrome c-type protein NrfH n=1 Tax=Thiorhodovibrio winogradskyi TaxID=77007 RepID=A0ABZ0SCN3_9GAMM|nr:cytochrome c nitrite reductase small subunit [Thiorhodovibrio winogradskyi]